MTLAALYVILNQVKTNWEFYALVRRMGDEIVAQHSKEDEPCNVSTSCERWTSSRT